MQTENKLRIGSRGSMLALWQANHVKSTIEAKYSDVEVEVVVIKTKGDIIQDVALSKIGDKGLFTKELELALLAGEVDLCVHSMKDMPTTLPEGLIIAGSPPRECAFDALVARPGVQSLDDLPRGARIGTGALRRRAQLYAMDKGFELVELRGNLDTRIKKVESAELDAVIVAAAGVNRLGWQSRIAAIIPPEIMTPAVGQGALALEIREEDIETYELLRGLREGQSDEAPVLIDAMNFLTVAAERFIMKELDGGCQVPIGAYAGSGDSGPKVIAMVAKTDGSKVIRVTHGESAGGVRGSSLFMDLARKALDDLLVQGAREVLDEARANAGADGSVAPLW